MQRNKVVQFNDIEVVGSSTSAKVGVIVDNLRATLEHYKSARTYLEMMWGEYYTSYLTTAPANQVNITNASRNIGIEKTWRHNVKAPVGYQTVETLVAYFMGAMFPNDRWFNLKPSVPIEDPQFQQIIELNRRYLSHKLNRGKFEQQTEIVLRECVISGTSAILHPWANGNLSFTALSPFEFYLDPTNPKPDEANLIRPYTLSKPEYMNYIETGLFNLCDKSEAYEDNESVVPHVDELLLKKVSRDLGVDSEASLNKNRDITIYEFWGDIHLEKENVILKNVRASWTSNGVLLNLSTNPFDSRPITVMTYIELGKSPYGIGAMQPVASQLNYRDTLTSRNADNVAVGSDAVLLYRQDAVLNPNDLKVRPGAKIPCTDPSAIVPLNMSFPNGMSVQEMAMADQMIDRALGTGAFIGVDRGRDADRVTAEEVAAQREAGGKRLSVVYSHINKTWLLPLLEVLHKYCQRFEVDTTVLSYGDVFVGVSPEAIQFPMEAVALGATNVADREYNLRQLLQWVELVGNSDKFSPLVNWQVALEEITALMLPDLYERLLQPQAQPEQPMAPDQALAQEMMSAAEFSQGQAGVRAMQGLQQSGQLMPEVQQNIQTLQGG